jgi:uncharacterized metal-binding protein
MAIGRLIMTKRVFPDCAFCLIPPPDRACMKPGGQTGKGCPTVIMKKVLDEAREEYKKPETYELARQASIQEGECFAGRERKPFVAHTVKPRIQEICEFATKMGYTRLGLVFCMGLFKEASTVGEILKGHGFELVSVCCKAGCVPKEEIGIKEDEKIRIGEHETMCNPVFQAKLLNDSKTQFNVLLGLCVGHDSLFFKYATALSTVLAVKDRVTGHNPLAAIYISQTYYEWLNPKSGMFK